MLVFAAVGAAWVVYFSWQSSTQRRRSHVLSAYGQVEHSLALMREPDYQPSYFFSVERTEPSRPARAASPETARDGTRRVESTDPPAAPCERRVPASRPQVRATVLLASLIGSLGVGVAAAVGALPLAWWVAVPVLPVMAVWWVRGDVARCRAARSASARATAESGTARPRSGAEARRRGPAAGTDGPSLGGAQVRQPRVASARPARDASVTRSAAASRPSGQRPAVWEHGRREHQPGEASPAQRPTARRAAAHAPRRHPGEVSPDASRRPHGREDWAAGDFDSTDASSGVQAPSAPRVPRRIDAEPHTPGHPDYVGLDETPTAPGATPAFHDAAMADDAGLAASEGAAGSTAVPEEPLQSSASDDWAVPHSSQAVVSEVGEGVEVERVAADHGAASAGYTAQLDDEQSAHASLHPDDGPVDAEAVEPWTYPAPPRRPEPTDDINAWQPTPLPPPTYTLKERAQQRPVSRPRADASSIAPPPSATREARPERDVDEGRSAVNQ